MFLVSTLISIILVVDSVGATTQPSTTIPSSKDTVCTTLVGQDSIAADTLVNDTIIENILDYLPGVVVHQAPSISDMVQHKRQGDIAKKEIEGFRLQVYASNSQQEAKNEAILLQKRLEPLFSEPVYVILEPPFWKVRIGDFLSREDASTYKQVVLEQCPDLQSSTYVVPDIITAKP